MPLLDRLQRVSPRTEDEAYEVDLRMLLRRDHDLVLELGVPVLERRGRLVGGVELLQPRDADVPLADELVPGAVQACVKPLAIRVVDGLRRRGAVSWILWYALQARGLR